MSTLEALHISKRVEDELWSWARATPVIEVCGIIDLDRQLVYPVRNISPQPGHSYTGHPDDTVAAVRACAGARMAVYHSHPTRRAEPSPQDIASATYGYQVLLSLVHAELRAYSVQGGDWTELATYQEESAR